MTKRDRKALLIGIALGIISAVLSAVTIFFLGIGFAVFMIVNPLVVSLKADQRIISLGTLPNLIMAILVGSLFRVWEGPIVIALLVFVLPIVFAVVISGIVKILRRRKTTPKSPLTAAAHE